MIIREWRGRANHGRISEYPRHFRSSVVPPLRKVSGFVGIFPSQRWRGDQVEFLVLTRWTSMGAIRAFGGSNPERAVVEPGTIAALTDYDETVQHHEVLEALCAS